MTRPPDTHSRLQDLVDEHFGYRPTTPVEELLTILETELRLLRTLIRRLAMAVGCDDEEIETIIWRAQALHYAVLGTHRSVRPAEGNGPDMCGDCGVDMEDALADAILCPAHGKRDDEGPRDPQAGIARFFEVLAEEDDAARAHLRVNLTAEQCTEVARILSAPISLFECSPSKEHP